MRDYSIRSYHMLREAEERRASALAATSLARDIHRDLADRHADRVWSIDEIGEPERPATS